MKLGSFNKLDNICKYGWEASALKGLLIIWRILFEKTSELRKMQYGCWTETFFTASTGSQWRFCKRLGIKSLTTSGEKLRSNVLLHKSSFKKFLIKWKINCDETGCTMIVLPGRTLTTVPAAPCGTKNNKILWQLKLTKTPGVRWDCLRYWFATQKIGDVFAWVGQQYV